MRNIIKLALVGLLSVSTIAVAAESSPEALRIGYQKGSIGMVLAKSCLLYTSDAADDCCRV